MDKKKTFEEMAEMMKSCCTGQGNMANCCSMMRKMMEFCKGEETKMKKKDTGETG